eukprot:5228478-Alexandrium_andersonii.AAC.1
MTRGAHSRPGWRGGPTSLVALPMVVSGMYDAVGGGCGRCLVPRGRTWLGGRALPPATPSLGREPAPGALARVLAVATS